MSLTSHLGSATSPIGQFLRQRFASSIGLTKEANKLLRSVTTIRPAVSDWPYGTLGMAIDYRIRYSFAITPSNQLVAWQGAPILAFKPLESDEDIPVSWEDLPHGVGIPTRLDMSGVPLDIAQGPYPWKLIDSFFASLDMVLAEIQPVRRRLEFAAEQLLARYCFVLSLFEEVFRSHRYLDGPLLMPAPKRSVEELLSIAEDPWIADLCAMAALFYDHYSHLLSQPAVLNPTFTGSRDVGSADADLIVDGCLIDIKASVQPKIDPEWLRQLAGYVLLDYTDELRIHSVGIYMARQGVLLTWSLTDFVHLLTGDETLSVEALRREFRQLCQRSRT